MDVSNFYIPSPVDIFADVPGVFVPAAVVMPQTSKTRAGDLRYYVCMECIYIFMRGNTIT